MRFLIKIYKSGKVVDQAVGRMDKLKLAEIINKNL